MKQLMIINPNLGIQCFKPENSDEPRRCIELARYAVIELNNSSIDKIVGGICEKHMIELFERGRYES